MLGRNTGKRKLHEVPEHRRVSPGAGAKALAAMRMAAAAAEDDASSVGTAYASCCSSSLSNDGSESTAQRDAELAQMYPESAALARQQGGASTSQSQSSLPGWHFKHLPRQWGASGADEASASQSCPPGWHFNHLPGQQRDSEQQHLPQQEQQARRSAEYIQQARRFERLSGERSRTSSDFAAGFLPSGSMAARALSEIRRPPAMPADVLSTSLLARAMFSTNGQQASTSGNKMAHYEMLQGRIGSALESLLEHHWQNKDRIATDPPPDDVLKRVNCLRPPSSNCIIPGLHAEEVRGLHGGPELLSLLMHHRYYKEDLSTRRPPSAPSPQLMSPHSGSMPVHSPALTAALQHLAAARASGSGAAGTAGACAARDGSPSSGDSSRRVSLGTIPEHADAIRSSNDSGSRNPRSSLGQRPEPLMLPSEVMAAAKQPSIDAQDASGSPPLDGQLVRTATNEDWHAVHALRRAPCAGCVREQRSRILFGLKHPGRTSHPRKDASELPLCSTCSAKVKEKAEAERQALERKSKSLPKGIIDRPRMRLPVSLCAAVSKRLSLPHWSANSLRQQLSQRLRSADGLGRRQSTSDVNRPVRRASFTADERSVRRQSLGCRSDFADPRPPLDPHRSPRAQREPLHADIQSYPSAASVLQQKQAMYDRLDHAACTAGPSRLPPSSPVAAGKAQHAQEAEQAEMPVPGIMPTRASWPQVSAPTLEDFVDILPPAPVEPKQATARPASLLPSPAEFAAKSGCQGADHTAEAAAAPANLTSRSSSSREGSTGSDRVPCDPRSHSMDSAAMGRPSPLEGQPTYAQLIEQYGARLGVAIGPGAHATSKPIPVASPAGVAAPCAEVPCSGTAMPAGAGAGANAAGPAFASPAGSPVVGSAPPDLAWMDRLPGKAVTPLDIRPRAVSMDGERPASFTNADALNVLRMCNTVTRAHSCDLDRGDQPHAPLPAFAALPGLFKTPSAPVRKRTPASTASLEQRSGSGSGSGAATSPASSGSGPASVAGSAWFSPSAGLAAVARGSALRERSPFAMHLDGQAPTADQQAAGSGSGPGQNGRSPSAAAAAAAASQQMVKRVSGRLQPSLSAICERASTDSNTRSSGDAFSSGDSGLGSWGGSGRPGLPNLAAASSLPLPRAANNDSLEGLPLWRRSFDEADRSEHAPLQRSGSLSRSHSLSMEGWRGPLRRASAESMAPTGSAPLSFVNRLPPRETLIQRSSSLSISGTLSDDSLASSTDPAASASQSELSPTSTQRLDAFQKSTWRPTSDAPACTVAQPAGPAAPAGLSVAPAALTAAAAASDRHVSSGAWETASQSSLAPLHRHSCPETLPAAQHAQQGLSRQSVPATNPPSPTRAPSQASMDAAARHAEFQRNSWAPSAPAGTTIALTPSVAAQIASLALIGQQSTAGPRSTVSPHVRRPMQPPTGRLSPSAAPVGQSSQLAAQAWTATREAPVPLQTAAQSVMSYGAPAQQPAAAQTRAYNTAAVVWQAAAQAFPSNGAPAQQPAGVFCSNGSAPIGRSTGSPTRTSAIYRASHAGTASISMLSAIQSSRERAARVTNPFAVTSAAAAGGAVVPGSGVSHAESEPKAKSAHDSSKWDQALSGEWQDAPASVRRCDSAWSLRLPRAQERRSLGCGGESEAGSKDLGPGSGESDAVAQEGVPELTAV